MISKKVLKAILIDLDGTLADTIPVLYETYLQFMAAKGQKGTSEEFATLMGPTIPQIVDILNKRYQWNESSDPLTQQYWHLLSTLYSEHLGLFSGAKRFIQQLNEKGVKIALVTSAASDLAESFLKKHQLSKYFDCIVTGDDVARGKPDPEAYLKALSKLQLHPEEALVIEDSRSGILSAQTAKIPTIQILHKDEVKLIEGAIPLLNWDAIATYYRATCE